MPSSTTLCVDCKTNESQIEVRKRRLCHECFTNYVRHKAVKRIDTYKGSKSQKQVGADKKKRFLLPLSGGLSSLVLLQILDAQVQRQIEGQGRTSFEMVLCHVVSHAEMTQRDGDWWSRVCQRFDGHENVPVVTIPEIFTKDKQMESDLALLGLRRGSREAPQDEALGSMQAVFDTPSNQETTECDIDFLERVLAAPKTATASSDLKNLLLKRLIVQIGKQQNCDTILWGHSNSKLAASTLAEVAKGRGGVVPTDLAEGSSTKGVNLSYPLRDLFRSELEMYLDILPEGTKELLLETSTIEEMPASLRLTSIDSLLSTYIDSQGEKYPSIMANVVRTAGKLQVPDISKTSKCALCAISTRMSGTFLCYGCERMKQDIPG